MSRPILETHESRLKKVLGVPQGEELPQDVQDLYWQCERVSRKINNRGVSDDTLILIAVLSGALSDEPEESFLETARLLDRGEPVQVTWRGTWVNGLYHGIKRNKIVVCVNGDAEEFREFDAKSVRLPSGAELAID